MQGGAVDSRRLTSGMEFEEAINRLQSEIASLKNIAYSGAFHDIQMSAVRDNLDSSIKSIIGRRNDFLRIKKRTCYFAYNSRDIFHV